MSYFDAILVVGALFVWAYGWGKGLIKSIGVFFAVAIGFLVATWLYEPAAAFIGGGTFKTVLAFAFIFVLANRLVALFILLLDRFWRMIQIIPLTKFINKLLGAVFAIAAYILGIGMGFPVVIRMVTNPFLLGQIERSLIMKLIFALTGILLPILPPSIRDALNAVSLL
ncbi:MAG: hypothetical protein UV70_C0001G0029 [Parcubacteria group bacterium GW2011_GWA2_43_13]|nr:MAG: hypothetical protein UV70_C0001G0029 [Parcubacteria group bacterium GW2011_GWA2_43_13]OGY70385.1 MAG: hypothetical protein A2986_00310 [Candidatus Jacksonbacteria bacterium RIFCSPLOWO2_01_FULL_44_13]